MEKNKDKSEKLSDLHKQIEGEVLQQTKFLETVLESVTYPLYVVDANNYTIKIANSAAHLATVNGKSTCYALAHKKDRPCGGAEHPCPLEIIKETKQPVTVEHIHYGKDGDIRNVEVHAFPIFDIKGNVTHIIEYCLDITERKRAEEALKRANEQLEQRVQERTAELVKINQQLRETIRKLKQKEEALRKSESALRKSQDNLRFLAGKLLSVQEEERRRLAREMHDDLTQRLAVLAIETGKLEHQLESSPKPVRDKLGQMKEQMVKLSADVHDISRQLHPAILDDLGLVDAIKSECASFSKREGISVSYKPINMPSAIPKDVALCIYRIMQEGLRNIAKHANVKEAEVLLTGTNDGVRLCVKDKGVGFDSAGDGVKGGLGLASMEERIRLIQGEISIQSQPGQGTAIKLWAPLSRRSE
jgi:PAS domain S-box-containing protein